jgi:uncharacterized damage-inducible protein DinB
MKADLHHYLRVARESVLWKLDGLSEYDIRRPMTPTGTNLLGLVKHLTGAEGAYFAYVFGQPFDGPMGPTGPDEDKWATAEESREHIVKRYQQACAHSDKTIEEVGLNAVSRVQWWPAEDNQATLHRILVHMIAETNRHAGHADVARELIDGAIGHHPDDHDMRPGDQDKAWWADHRAQVELAAREAGGLPLEAE